MKHIKDFKLFEEISDEDYIKEVPAAYDDVLHSKKKRIEELKNKIQIQEDKMRKYPSRNILDMINSYKEELKDLESKWVKPVVNSNEGKTFKDTKKLYPKKVWDADKKIDFKKQIKNHVKSQRLETKEVGNDLEVIFRDDVIAQVMFRNDYVGVRAKGEKFVDEFKYTELGKIKSAVSSIIKKCKN